MADKELPDLTEEESPAEDDIVYLVKDPSGTALDRKTTLGSIHGLLNPVALSGDAADVSLDAEGVTATDVASGVEEIADNLGTVQANLLEPQSTGSSLVDLATVPGKDRRHRRGFGGVRKTAAVASTTAETSLFTTVPQLAAGGLTDPSPTVYTNILFRARGQILQNNATPRDITIRVKPTGGGVITVAYTGLTQSATARQWLLDGSFVIGDFFGVAEIVSGDLIAWLDNVPTRHILSGGADIDPAAAFDVDLTTQHSFSAATVTNICEMFHMRTVEVA